MILYLIYNCYKFNKFDNARYEVCDKKIIIIFWDRSGRREFSKTEKKKIDGKKKKKNICHNLDRLEWKKKLNSFF